MAIRILNEAETRGLIDSKAAIACCRQAYAKQARGEVEQPDVLTIEVREQSGEVHAKGGYLHGTPNFSIKVASGFYRNPERGLPSTSGAVWVFDATTGFPKVLILDNGFLTELRTGAAGAIAADLLARQNARTVAVLGAGSQARYQIEALAQVRPLSRVTVWSRTPARAQAYAAEMGATLGVPVTVAPNPRVAVADADIVVTTTPSDQPLLEADWIRPGTHITAMGSDMPHKRELATALLARSKLVVDRLSQCLTQGELHHAVAEKAMQPEQVYAELGEIAAGLKLGRGSDAEITVADQTGVGVLDAAVANHVTERAEQQGVGRWLEL